MTLKFDMCVCVRAREALTQYREANIFKLLNLPPNLT